MRDNGATNAAHPSDDLQRIELKCYWGEDNREFEPARRHVGCPFIGLIPNPDRAQRVATSRHVIETKASPSVGPHSTRTAGWIQHDDRIFQRMPGRILYDTGDRAWCGLREETD